MELISKYKNVLTDDVLHALQSVNVLYQQTTKTEDSQLLYEIITKLIKDAKIFKYLLTFTKFIFSNFDAPFDLNTLDLLRPGNTFHNWSKHENQCQFNIINKDTEYTITYPAYPAPITVYRNLRKACYIDDECRVAQSCIQSEKLLQYQLVAWFLLSIIYFINFILVINNNHFETQQKRWHQDEILYQHPEEEFATILIDGRRKRWKSKLNQLEDPKTIESLLNNRLAPHCRQQVSNLNEFLYSEFKKWFTYVQMCGIKLWMLYVYIAELKHDMLCLDYVMNNINKFPSFPDWYFDNLQKFFSEMMGFDTELQDAIKYGYEEITLKPVNDKDFFHWLQKAVIKRPSWIHKHTKILFNYALNELKILQNDIELNDKHIHDCWLLLKKQFTKERIKNKLLMLFFKFCFYFSFYIFIFFL